MQTVLKADQTCVLHTKGKTFTDQGAGNGKQASAPDYIRIRETHQRVIQMREKTAVDLILQPSLVALNVP
jgi:hypothetical protein